MRRPIAACGAVVLILGLAACRNEPAAPEDVEVARFGDHAVSLADLQAYLAVQLPDAGQPAETGDDGLDAVRSRLLDQLVDERLLLSEAERLGIEVEPWEAEAYAAMDRDTGDPDGGGYDEDAEARAARDRLMVEKLLETRLADLPPPDEDDVKAWAEAQRDRLVPERRLELSALLFESEKLAKRVYREIRARRMTFTEAVVAYEAYPGQVRPARIDWQNLSASLREELGKLKPGQVSPPLEFHGQVYLFRVDTWFREPDQIEAELLRRARIDLMTERRREAQVALLDELRARTPVRIFERSLPFRYVPDD